MEIDRVDGRTANQLRPLACSRNILNRAHGSASWSQGKFYLPFFTLNCLLFLFFCWTFLNTSFSLYSPYNFMFYPVSNWGFMVLFFCNELVLSILVCHCLVIFFAIVCFDIPFCFLVEYLFSSFLFGVWGRWGSVTFGFLGDTKVLAAVYGPKAGVKKNENPEKACVEVIWKPKTGQIGEFILYLLLSPDFAFG